MLKETSVRGSVTALHATVADTGFSRTGGVGLLFGLKNKVHFGHKRSLVLIGFQGA